jgi:hypothetical protein
MTFLTHKETLLPEASLFSFLLSGREKGLEALKHYTQVKNAAVKV